MSQPQPVGPALAQLTKLLQATAQAQAEQGEKLELILKGQAEERKKRKEQEQEEAAKSKGKAKTRTEKLSTASQALKKQKKGLGPLTLTNSAITQQTDERISYMLRVNQSQLAQLAFVDFVNHLLDSEPISYPTPDQMLKSVLSCKFLVDEGLGSAAALCNPQPHGAASIAQPTPAQLTRAIRRTRSTCWPSPRA